MLHLLHSGFLICRGLKLFLLAVTVTLLSALGVWQSQLFTFHRPLVRCHFYPTIHSEKSVVLRGASTPFVSKSHCSPPGSRPEATWCWIDFEIAVSCFFKKTPWGTKFPLNLTFSSFSPHRNYLTVKLRSINDHWGHWKKKNAELAAQNSLDTMEVIREQLDFLGLGSCTLAKHAQKDRYSVNSPALQNRVCIILGTVNSVNISRPLRSVTECVEQSMMRLLWAWILRLAVAQELWELELQGIVSLDSVRFNINAWFIRPRRLKVLAFPG